MEAPRGSAVRGTKFAEAAGRGILESAEEVVLERSRLDGRVGIADSACTGTRLVAAFKASPEDGGRRDIVAAGFR